jgi:hypothetical protein
MGLGDKLKDWVTEFADIIAKPFEYALAWGVERAIKRAIPNSYTYFEQVVKLMEGAPGSPSLKELVETGKLQEMFANAQTDQEHHSAPVYDAVLIDTISAIGAILGSPLGLLPFIGDIYSAGWGEVMKRGGRDVARPTLLEAQHIIKLHLMRKISDGEMTQELGWLGYSDDRIALLTDALRPLLNPDILRDYALRGETGDVNWAEELTAQGWTAERISAMMKLWWRLPPVQDLIRMAVREAFTPEIAEKFGQYQDFPPAFAEWAKKEGISDFWARAYWAAHWDLPSPSQGFEMLHRGVIDQPTLELLLRALDVMPYWRDKLTQIAYSPFTRVDVRRMHAMGILTRDQVKQAYKDIGFDDAKAEAMTEFTIQYNAGADKDLNKTDVLSLYNKGVLTEVEAKERLLDLDYSEEDADYLIAIENTHAAAAAHELSLTQIKSLALAGIIDRGDATARLADLGYTAEDIANLYSLWELEAVPQDAKPSRTDLARFYGAGIITLDEWVDNMYALRYSEQAIAWYYMDMEGGS